MAEDPAAYLARRVRAEHGLSARATVSELLHVCEQRGVAVFWRPRLRRAGYYCDWPYPVIVLRHDAPPRALAHELMHHLLLDNECHGIHYRRPEFRDDDPERLAERFERLLCGDGE
jgi:Zn-dependent peptidase ImmA (M78 family)